MIAADVKNQKKMMASLLTGSGFDCFDLVSCSVTTFAEFNVDGLLRKQFFDAAGDALAAKDDTDGGADPAYTPWSMLRPHILNLIRGNRAPLSFRMILRLNDKTTEEVLAEGSADAAPADLNGFYLNVAFDGAAIRITTGTSFKQFSLDKTAERLWDAYILAFMEKAGILLEDPGSSDH